MSKSHTSKSVFIIVLNWNGLSDTLECLASLRALDYPNYSVVVVDNGSTDGSVPALREQFPEAHIIENTHNLGYAEGNNQGISYALAQGAGFVLVLNNDTVVEPALLTKLVSAAETHPDAGILSPRIYMLAHPTVLWFAGGKWIPERATLVHVGLGQEDDGASCSGVVESDYASGCALFFRAEVAERIGLMDARFFAYWEEADWCYRAKAAGYKILVTQSACLWHKISSSSSGSPGTLLRNYYQARNRLLWFERNLRGTARLKAYVRYLRELRWYITELRSRTTSIERKAILMARVRGALHYVVRHFGPAPRLS